MYILNKLILKNLTLWDKLDKVRSMRNSFYHPTYEAKREVLHKLTAFHYTHPFWFKLSFFLRNKSKKYTALQNRERKDVILMIEQIEHKEVKIIKCVIL